MTADDKRTTVSILRKTKEALRSLKHPGQSFDGVIQELIKVRHAKKPSRCNEGRRG